MLIPQNGLLDPNSVRSLITEKTKAIVLVHYAGMVCDMDEFYKKSPRSSISPLSRTLPYAMGKYNGKIVEIIPITPFTPTGH